ncbi:MAG TPA: winged helix-turn-helix domain-containing protein [Candidatus Acidoferrales bacterium]|nr:winged helix-turn-helix domain-containing protein [Candidatus Acidoferrales bacterium]
MGVSHQDRTTIRFGPYELDLQAGVLLKDGTRVRCQEQPLQVLAALAERTGEVVTREELRQRVWPQDTFVDFDHALNTAIKKIRAALNDDADAPRYIETIPRRGYRFLAKIEPALSAQPPATAIPRPKNHRLRSIVVIAAAVLVILAIIWKIAPWHGESYTTPEFQRLTFNMPELGTARFTPDGASVVFSAGWRPNKGNIYMQRLGASGAQRLDTNDARLLSVSRQADLAVLAESSKSLHGVPEEDNPGTLALVPLEGGGPREILPQVEDADWSPGGQLAVVRRVGEKSRLEFPPGKILCETSGWIASPRFSPGGDAIAFIDHPITPDDRGSVAIVDLEGNKKTLSGFWESVRGLAWSPRGDEVWFSAARSGVSRALYGVALNGQERRVLSVAGGMSLRDISRDGRTLVSRDNERLGIVFVGSGQTETRELSWKDWSMVTDISADGKQVLFGEEGENSGLSYQVGLRSTDGAAPVILGSGIAQAMSPDGKWALSIMPPPDDQIILLPTGAGSSKSLERGAVERYAHSGASWFPDARQIVFVASEAGHGRRCYVQSIDGGKPRAFTAEGMVRCSVSPSGSILAMTDDSQAFLYRTTSGGEPDKKFKIEPGERMAGWTSDGKFLYLVENQQTPLIINRFEIESGRRSLWKPVVLPASDPDMRCEQLVITPDGQSYAYTFSNHSSDLYVVAGLK